MSSEETVHSWEELEKLIVEEDAVSLGKFLETISPGETALAVSRLNDEYRKRLLVLLEPAEAADLLDDLPDEQAVDLIDEISPVEAAAIVDQMPSDAQADILADLSAANAEAILDAMSPEEAETARELLKYPKNTAGGIMVTEFLAYLEIMTVDDVIQDLKTHVTKYADYDVQYAYITSAGGGLIGVLRMRDLLLSRGESHVRSVMIANPICLSVHTSLDELKQLFEEHTFLGIPVADEENRLIGLVRRTDVTEASHEQVKNAFLRVSGIVGGEEFRSMPFLRRSFRRLSWLSINIVLNVLAASVIALYQDTLSAVIALAVFLPIISDMSGCSGNQAVAVSIRELSLGLVKPQELARVLFKEIGIGLTNGFVLGILLGSVALLWKGNPYLGLVVGGALATNTVVSVCLGGVVPLFLKLIRIDPALASGPILTTVTDMCGFFFALSFATALLPLLC